MVLDYSLNDNSANIARTILYRGVNDLENVLKTVCGGTEFLYVACPDFSISLRQRRLILGLPIGGYVRWNSDYRFFPIELDVNSCGVHVLELGTEFDKNCFQDSMFRFKKLLDNHDLVLDGVTLKWNFSRRNHFINVYQNKNGVYYLVSHSSGETSLFDWDNLHKMFDVKYFNLNCRCMPYIIGNDVDCYYSIAKKENDFFFARHDFLFDILLGKGKYKKVYANQHFGMISQGEILMGCSKLKPGTIFPILTRPFADILVAKASNPSNEILSLTNGYALVPHGLGMTISSEIKDIIPSKHADGYVEVFFDNGSSMITDTLEYVGIWYRSLNVIPEMSKKSGFEIVDCLKPILFTKI